MLTLHRNSMSKSMGLFLCNSNKSLKWKRGCMVKVNINLLILLIVCSSKRNMQLQPGRWMHTTFQTGRLKSCCNLDSKETLIYNKFPADLVHLLEKPLIENFIFLCRVNSFRILLDFFGCNIQTCISWNHYWKLFLEKRCS